jgi:hypothetical protein
MIHNERTAAPNDSLRRMSISVFPSDYILEAENDARQRRRKEMRHEKDYRCAGGISGGFIEGPKGELDWVET